MSSISISRRLKFKAQTFESENENKSSVRMSSRRYKVKQSMNAIITESGIALDTRLLCKDIIILAFKVADYFLETGVDDSFPNPARMAVDRKTHADSLSILSPNPGVSTIVSAIRTPSSSSSKAVKNDKDIMVRPLAINTHQR